MKLVAAEEIAAPRERLWPHVADFDGFEERAARRIGPVARTPPGPPAAGTVWNARVDVMGRPRDIAVTLARVDPPARLEVAAAADGVALTILLELEALSPRRTRLTVTTEATASGIGGRVLLQSARLARTALLDRYRSRVSAFAGMVEENAAMS